MSTVHRDERQVALVTGAGKGIGRGVARLLEEGGYRVGIVARTEGDLLEVAGAGEMFCVPGDVSKAAEVVRVVGRVVERFGRLDAVVNCAGTAPRLSVEETSIEEWHRVLDTNLSSAFYLAKACWPVFKRAGGGVMVNVSSEAARDPFDGFAAYGSAKAGLNLLGRALAKEGSQYGIRVHTVAPAAVETGMFRKLATEEQWPREKTLEAEEVARVIVDCIGGSLRYTSGEVIWVHKTI